MRESLSHRERLEACLKGEVPDRPPVALWRHFPVDDQQPANLAASTLLWQKIYDWDMVKVTPASSFCLKDWGVEDKWENSSEGTRRYTKRIINAPEDWLRLKPLGTDAPYLAAQLKSLSYIRKGLEAETPLIQTIFSPLAQARNLAGDDKLLTHLRQEADMVKQGLSVIAETTRLFIQAALEVGIDGIFYAVQHAQASRLTEAEFNEFGVGYDIPSLEAASPAWLNIVHAHGENIYFDLLSTYPAQILNWHDQFTPPSLATGKTRWPGVVCGGLSQETLVLQDAATVRREAREAIAQTDGKRFILGTGCVVPITAPHGNLITARKIVEKK